jgi:Caspase domain
LSSHVLAKCEQDDGKSENPTHSNILNAFRALVANSEAGDSAFFHYSGHGGRLADDNGDEDDGYDETLIPVDYKTAGQIRDDAVFTELVSRMPSGSTLMCLMDCCHSGSIMDLPYIFKADGEQSEMGVNPNAHLDRLKRMAIKYLIQKIFGTGPLADVVTMVLIQVATNEATLSFLQGLFRSVCSPK